jgi:hypothetical protein
MISLVITWLPATIAGLLWHFGGKLGESIVIGGMVFGIASAIWITIQVKATELAKVRYPGLFPSD